MAQAYSVYTTGGPLLDVEESEITGHVKLSIVGDDDSMSITVEAVDLARALITASPAFTKGIGEIAQRAILQSLGRDDDSAADE